MASWRPSENSPSSLDATDEAPGEIDVVASSQGKKGMTCRQKNQRKLLACYGKENNVKVLPSPCETCFALLELVKKKNICIGN